MPLNSQEEDELFAAYGWIKDLIKRQWTSPCGRMVVTFDQVVEISKDALGEEHLVRMIGHYGWKGQRLGD